MNVTDIPQIIFIAEIANFFDRIAMQNGKAAIENESALPPHQVELTQMAKKLSGLKEKKIKFVLNAFVSGDGHSFLGNKIAELLLKELKTLLPSKTFNSLIQDPILAHLYKPSGP